MSTEPKSNMNIKDQIIPARSNSAIQLESVLPTVRRLFFEELRKKRNEDLRSRRHKNLRANIKRERKQSLIDRVGESLVKHYSWLLSWVEELQKVANSENDERVSENLNNLRLLLGKYEKQSRWDPEDVEHLVGIPRLSKEKVPKFAYPSLAGWSLMYVSPHYNEIYYVDIISDILPKSIVNFVQNSVFVPRINGQWVGSVGKAVNGTPRRKHRTKSGVAPIAGVNRVVNSFLDPFGVVACEDLLEGNVSILMRCVYEEPDVIEHNKSGVLAVAFCFFPVPDVFEDSEMRKFAKVVDSQAVGVRKYCREIITIEIDKHLLSLSQFHQSLNREISSSDALLDVLVATETNHTSVGAVMGLYYKATGRGQLAINSVKVAGSFLERELARRDALPSVIGELTQNRSPEISVSVGPLAEILFYPLRPGIDISQIAAPPEVVEPLQHLWDVFCTCPVNIEDRTKRSILDSQAEPAKIAADMIAALIGQMTDYISYKCWDNRDFAQILRNIRQILLFAYAYIRDSGASHSSLVYPDESNIEGKLQAFIDIFTGWADLIAKSAKGNALAVVGRVRPLAELEMGGQCKGAALWRGGIRSARIDEKTFHSILTERILKHTIFTTDLDNKKDHAVALELWKNSPPICHTIAKNLGLESGPVYSPERIKTGVLTDGFLLLLSLEPLRGDKRTAPDELNSNPVVRLATAFYAAFLTEGMAQLAAYARGASHGLKNALAAAEWILGRVPEEARQRFDKLVLPPRDNKLVQELLNNTLAVQQEIKYLQNQSELFFWIMDPDRAKYDIAYSNKKVYRKIDNIFLGSLIRGLELGIKRLHPEQLASVLVSPGGDYSWIQLKDDLQRDLIDCHRIFCEAELAGTSTQDALSFLLVLLRRHLQLDFRYTGNIPLGQPTEITARILDAVLVELFQNATKAAIKSGASVPSLSVMVTPENGNKVTMFIANAATEDDIRQLRRVFSQDGKQRGSHVQGLSGLWQIELLERLAQGQITLLPPEFNNNTVAMRISLQLDAE